MVTINGVDLQTLGLVVSGYTGDLAPAWDAAPTLAVPGISGTVPNGAAPVVPDRTLAVKGTLTAATPRLLEQAARALLAWCAGSGSATPGAVTLAIPGVDATALVQWTVALRASSTVERSDPASLATTAAVSLTFTAAQPYGEDASETVLALADGAPGVIAATAAAAALGPFPPGTVPTLPIVEFSAPPGSFGDAGTAPRTARLWTRVPGPGVGALVASLTIAPGAVVVAGSTVEVDMGAQAVTLVAPDGTRAPRASWLAAGDFFALDPADAALSYGGALAVDLEGAGRVRYRRRWL